MEDMYINHGKKRLRCGYTTGTCAAAASAAAAEYLLSGIIPQSVIVSTPKGIRLTLAAECFGTEGEYASCGVKKDSGDDPDITNGVMIFAKVRLCESGIYICGGEGVGIVTKKGLDRPIGDHAINSVPRKMIGEALSGIAERYDYSGGFEVTIYVPEGRELAKKTYNPYMGIEGGISIIGTTGIVEPMSTAALVDTIRAEASMRKAEGREYMLLTLGNYGEDFLKNMLPNALGHSVKCSNYIGEAIDIALELDFRGVLIVGHIGKTVKLGSGIMNTHSSMADGRMETLIACGVMAGADCSVLRSISSCATADDAFSMLYDAGCADKTIAVLMEKIQYHLDKKVQNEMLMGAVVFSNRYGIIGQTETAHDLIDKILSEDKRIMGGEV